MFFFSYNSYKTNTSYSIFYSLLDYFLCRISLKHSNYKGHSCVFSKDGSLLAVAHESLVTLWNVDQGCCVKILTFPPPEENIIGLVFCEGYLVVRTGEYENNGYIHVWDLLKCTIAWSLRISNRGCANGNGGLISLGNEFGLYVETQGLESKLMIYNVKSPSLIQSCSISENSFGFTAIPHPVSGLEILFLNAHKDLELLTPILPISSTSVKDTTLSPSTESSSHTSFSETVGLFSSIFKKPITESSHSFSPTQLLSESNPSVYHIPISNQNLLEGPSHILPPPSILFDSYLKLHLKPRTELISSSNNSKKSSSQLEQAVMSSGASLNGLGRLSNENQTSTGDEDVIMDDKEDIGYKPKDVSFIKEYFKRSLGIFQPTPPASPPSLPKI